MNPARFYRLARKINLPLELRDFGWSPEAVIELDCNGELSRLAKSANHRDRRP